MGTNANTVPRPPRYDLSAAEPLFGGALPAQFGSFLAGAELFDARLFGLHASEAALLDPQQRLLLECAAELVMAAGGGGLAGGAAGVRACGCARARA